MIPFTDLTAINALARGLRIDPQAIRRSRIAYFKKSRGIDAALAEIPAESRDAFARAVSFRSLGELRRFDSSVDGASKLVSKTADGFSIESVVLRPATGRTALCVSSQVGCAAACAFCATGQMGVARDLSAEQILDQVVLANEALREEDRRVRNIVFMGMGEPMHNVEAVHAALATLQDPAAFDHSPGRILVSTVGVPEPLVRTAEQFPRTNFALSLHAATQATRERIIPLARRYSLDTLRETVRALNQIQPEKTSVMIEYLMLDALNDRPADAEALIEWLDGLRVHVNLIPFNPIPQEPELRSSPRETIEAFSVRLREAGYATTIRYSLGRDIEAACGQLVRDENREVARRLSAGAR